MLRILLRRTIPLCLLWQLLLVRGFTTLPAASLPAATTSTATAAIIGRGGAPQQQSDSAGRRIGGRVIGGQQHQTRRHTSRPDPSTTGTTTLSLSSTSSSTAAAAALQQLQPLPQLPQLSPFEDWCAREVEEWYQKATAVKCPFFKRRFVDLLDGVDMILGFLVIRHKSLDIFGPPPGHRSKLLQESQKTKHLSLAELQEAIRYDWREDAGWMGYYITGQLNTALFRDDCLFDGPDPDMPVRGLRKYVNAASQLFDRSQSRAELLSLDSHTSTNTITARQGRVVVAHWRMRGVLRLPWKPRLPQWTGRTTYHIDDDGLVFRHEEEWDMSVGQAFLKTFAPDVAERLWPTAISTAITSNADSAL